MIQHSETNLIEYKSVLLFNLKRFPYIGMRSKHLVLPVCQNRWGFLSPNAQERIKLETNVTGKTSFPTVVEWTK